MLGIDVCAPGVRGVNKVKDEEEEDEEEVEENEEVGVAARMTALLCS